MQVLVLYYSKSGNARKLAEYIAHGINSVKDVRAMLKSTKYVTKDDFLDSTGIIAGSHVCLGSMAWDLKRVFEDFDGLQDRMQVKVGAAFATSDGASCGCETTIISIVQALLNYGIVMVGDASNSGGHLGMVCVGEYDEKAVERAKNLGHRVAELCMKLQS